MLKKIKLLVLLIFFFTIVLSGCTSQEKKDAINAFVKASANVEKMNSDLDNQILDAESLIQKNEKALDENAIRRLETVVSEAKAKKVTIPERPKELESIKNEIERLNKTDYTHIIQQLTDSKTEYENSIKQLKQVTAPTESFVIGRIQTVKGITGISAVTEENDPNRNLGKQGGYISQVYFSYDLINQEDIIGNSIIEKGTECGGSIEVYRTIEDAEKRNSYLASFDGSILSSGSHCILGSIVIRTSNELTASKQKELETNLINNLVELR